VLQEAGFEEESTVAELVRLYGGFYPHPRGPDEVIEQVGLADRVAVLRAGRLAAIGAPDTLGGSARSSVLSFRMPEGTDLADLPRLTGEVEAHAAAVTVRTGQAARDMHTLTGWALERRVELTSLTLTLPRPSLEDVYPDLTEEVGERPGPQPADGREPATGDEAVPGRPS
jgi:ABC-type multidrug transport system ATPase subunit